MIWDGRILLLLVQIDDIKYVIGSVYAPNKDTPKFFTELFNQIDLLECENIIVGGDMNLVMNLNLDSTGRLSNNFKSVRVIEECMVQNKISDAWRAVNGSKQDFTWYRRRPFCSSRLDMFFISDGLIQHIENMEILKGGNSDHATITMRVAIEQVERGAGLWKMNNLMLEDEQEVNKLTEHVQSILERLPYSGTNQIERWENLKLQISQYLKNAGKMRTCNRKEKLASLEEQQAILYQELTINNGNELTVQCLDEVQSRISEIETDIARSAAFRGQS